MQVQIIEQDLENYIYMWIPWYSSFLTFDMHADEYEEVFAMF